MASDFSRYDSSRSKISNQRITGQYMTPELIAEEMCRQIRRPVCEWTVLDPACGDGNLLLAVAAEMKAAGIENIAPRLIGIDIDPAMAAKARIRLAEFISCKETDIQVFCADFLDASRELFRPNSPITCSNFNVVLSNPPYGGSREYHFFTELNKLSNPGTEFVFLVPLAFLDRVYGVTSIPLNGRPMGVTTGHAIIHHICGEPFSVRRIKGAQANTRSFNVLSGIKLYEEGAGVPPQSAALINAKPYSSEQPREGWLPCLRTGDIKPFSIQIGRMWVDYGEHLAHPKELGRFTGPKVFVRRMPIWANRQLGAAYSEMTILCAGDVLVIKQDEDDKQLLRGLCVYLNSREAAEAILQSRPSVRYRMSFPKISAKDLNQLIEDTVPSDIVLKSLAAEYKDIGE